MERILEDKREIEEIFYNAHEIYYRVGTGGVEKIEAYGEAGHMATIPYFAIWVSGHVKHRVPADAVTVSYLTPEAQDAAE